MNRNEGVDHWKDSQKFFEDGCPFCGCDVFLEGPHGGECVNFKCIDCETVFNNTPFGVDLLSGLKNNTTLLTPPDEAA